MITVEAQTTNPTGGEAAIPDDLTIMVTMRRPFFDGTTTVVAFIPETSRGAIFQEYREIAHGIAGGIQAAEDDDFDDLDAE